MSKKDKPKNEKNDKKKSESDLVTRESISAVCALFLLFSLLVLCTRDVIFGEVGVAIFYFIMGTFGYASYPVVLFGLYISVTSLFGVKFVKNKKAATALFFSVVFLILILHVALTRNIPASDYLKACWTGGEYFSTATVGGVAFGSIAFGLISITKPVGAIIIFACFFLFCAYLFVISVKKNALFHKKPILEGYDHKDADDSPAIIVEGEPMQEVASAATDNGYNGQADAANATGNYAPSRSEAERQTPVNGGTVGYGNAYNGGNHNGYNNNGYPRASVSQRPGFMLADENAEQARQNAGENAAQPQGNNGAYSPFGYSARQNANAANRPAQVNESPQDGRAFLFGLDPAESYRRNLIFDETANVNRRKPYEAPTNAAPVNVSPLNNAPANNAERTSAYTPSYLDDYENSVNDTTPTQSGANNAFGQTPDPVSRPTYYTSPETPTQPQSNDFSNDFSNDYAAQQSEEGRSFRTGFGADETEDYGARDEENGRSSLDETPANGADDSYYGNGSNGYELNVSEDRYGAETPRDSGYELRDENGSDRGYDDGNARDDFATSNRGDDFGFGNSFDDGRGTQTDSDRFGADSSRFDDGRNGFEDRDERSGDFDNSRSDRGFDYSSYTDRNDGYELRDSDDERGDGSAFGIFDDEDRYNDGDRFGEEDRFGGVEETRDSDRNARYFEERGGREIAESVQDDYNDFGFDDSRSDRGDLAPQKPVEKPVEKPAPPPKPRVIKPYVRVPIDMFDCRDVMPDANEIEVAKTKEIIIETLGYFRVNDATISSVTFGPTVTRYNVVVPRNIAAKKVVALDQEIALNLQAKEGVNIYPNFEDGAVSIEVPNRNRQFVQLGCMLTGDAYVNAKPNSLTFSMGKDVGNRKVYGDICKMIHLLVAGSSGSGKSVFLGSLIISLITKYSPAELRLILIDPKKTEFVLYNDLPHLMINEIITDVNKAIQSLNWAIGEMNRRYTLFEKMSREGTYVVNIDEYNAHLPEGEEKLPKIVVIIDELADLMLAAKKEVEDRIQNLTQKARAAGIHLIVATQRPSADVITGVIKGNLPTRIAFAVASEVDSRVILDQTGAQKLLGKGDFLYTMSGVNTPVRVQSAFSSSEESQNVIRYIKMNNEAYFDESATAFINNTKTTGDDSSVAGEESVEEVYIEALRCVLMAGNASISMIQRKCSVGYNRAGKIVEWMEEMGYISAFDGAKARKVLITKEEFVSKYGPL